MKADTTLRSSVRVVLPGGKRLEAFRGRRLESFRGRRGQKSGRSARLSVIRRTLPVLCLILVSLLVPGCSVQVLGDSQLARNVYVELVDWHISGLWIVNSPVCWLRVVNYNHVPIKDVRIRFKTFGYNGEQLSTGTYTLEGVIGPGQVKNFTEQSIGVVDLESDMLAVEVDTVEKD